VWIQPISAHNSLLTGNLTGIFATKLPFVETAGRKVAQISVRYMQIPYAEEQGISCNEQGIAKVASANLRRMGVAIF
jgi:hypothetical protein